MGLVFASANSAEWQGLTLLLLPSREKESPKATDEGCWTGCEISCLAARPSCDRQRPSSFQHPSSDLAFASLCSATFSHKGRRENRALRHCHARRSVWPLLEPFDRLSSPGSGARWPCLWTKLYGATSAPRRRFLFPSVPLRPGGAFSHPHHLAHRPAHRGRSAPGGTLGRNLPGRRVFVNPPPEAPILPRFRTTPERSRQEGRGDYAGCFGGVEKDCEIFFEGEAPLQRGRVSPASRFHRK